VKSEVASLHARSEQLERTGVGDGVQEPLAGAEAVGRWSCQKATPSRDRSTSGCQAGEAISTTSKPSLAESTRCRSPGRLEHEIPRAEGERRSLVLVDDLRLSREAVDQLEPDPVVVHAILDRTAPRRSDVAGDPATAEPRGQEISVEQAGAALVERSLGEAVWTKSGAAGERFRRLGAATSTTSPAGPTYRPGASVPPAGRRSSTAPGTRGPAQLQPVAGHQGLGRVVGGSDLVQAEPEAFQEVDA
jgi:hypothetical protein